MTPKSISSSNLGSRPVKERPILFSAPMVRALLDGRKTQTRRVVKPQPYIDARGNVCVADPKRGEVMYGQHPDGSPQWENFAHWRCPYGVPGDRLWVKETLRRSPHVWTYAADGAEVGWPARGTLAFKARDVVTAIHCSREASRITLEITRVRVERLNDCSEADALAEGIYRVDPDANDLANGCTPDDFVFMAPGTRQGWGMTKAERDREQWAPTAQSAYGLLWTHINGPDSWAANPWVWVVEFRRVDAITAAAA